MYTRVMDERDHLPIFGQDPETDSVEPFARKHMEVMARLGGALPGFDVISTVGIVQDVPPALSDLYGTLEMVANTTKPLVLLVSDEKVFAKVLDLVEHLVEIINQLPDLRLSPETLGLLERYRWPANVRELRQTANQLVSESVHVDEVVQHDTSTWNVHLSPRKEGKRILLNFTGIYCTNCRDMETGLLPLPEVVAESCSRCEA